MPPPSLAPPPSVFVSPLLEPPLLEPPLLEPTPPSAPPPGIAASSSPHAKGRSSRKMPAMARVLTREY
jgi:hypothetical protein